LPEGLFPNPGERALQPDQIDPKKIAQFEQKKPDHKTEEFADVAIIVPNRGNRIREERPVGEGRGKKRNHPSKEKRSTKRGGKKPKTDPLV